MSKRNIYTPFVPLKSTFRIHVYSTPSEVTTLEYHVSLYIQMIGAWLRFTLTKKNVKLYFRYVLFCGWIKIAETVIFHPKHSRNGLYVRKTFYMLFWTFSNSINPSRPEFSFYQWHLQWCTVYIGIVKLFLILSNEWYFTLF